MKSVALFIVLLLAVSQATETGVTTFLGMPLNFGPKRSIFNLLTQIEAKLKLGGPLDAITKMIGEFKQEVTNEQVAHDGLFAKQQVSCNEELAFREKEIADATGALRAAKETLDGCQSQSVRANGDLSITKTQLQETSEYLIVIQDVRKRDSFNYETQVTTLQALKQLFEECLVIIEEIFQGENTFAQLARHTNKILKTAVAARQINGMGALLQIMVQMASSQDLAVDEQLFQRIKELLKNQLQKTEDELAAVVAAEEAAVQSFNAESERVTGIVLQLQQAVQDLEVEITQLDKCIVNQSGIVNSSQAKLDRNTKLQQDAQNLCTTVELEYKSASEKRRQELALLAAIQERVEARFAQLSTGVTERGKQDAFQYNAENDYDHQSFTASNQQ